MADRTECLRSACDPIQAGRRHRWYAPAASSPAQVVVVAAWLLVRWCRAGLVDEGERRPVDVPGTLNPLVFAVGVLGAHVDVLATARS